MTLPLPYDVTAFHELIGRAQSCRACPEMSDCNRVLSDANGPGHAKIMFIGEAPGRLGAERTAIPFHGDTAGENFERLLALAGLSRAEVFVTNSILCNPTDAKGNNAPPSKQSIRNCSHLLADQIEIVGSSIIVTLGAAALSALNLISPHELTLSKSVRTTQQWNGRTLIPLYHPGARAMIHRNFVTQTADYYFVGEKFRRLDGGHKSARAEAPSRAGWKVVEHVLSKFNTLTLFQLHKIMYLIDYRSTLENGSRVTDFFYIRQKDGPYCVELGTKWYKKYDGLHITFQSGVPILNWCKNDLFFLNPNINFVHQRWVNEFLDSLGTPTDSKLKTRAYLTAPMKRALNSEKFGRVGLNRALL